jgi:hypothetical protein
MGAIRVCLVLFIGWAAIGLAHAQGTMSGMNNSMPDGQLIAAAGQGQGPHDNGTHPPGGGARDEPGANFSR